jgi:DNA-binding CsgD family transcriptional regulator
MLTTEVLVGDIVERAQTACDEIDLKREILVALETWLPHQWCAWVPPTAIGGGASIYREAPDVGCEAKVRPDFSRWRYYISQILPRLEATRGVGTDREIVTPAEREAHPVFTEIFRPARIHSLLMCAVQFRGRSLSGLTLGRRDRNPPFTARDRDRMRALRSALGLVEAAFVGVQLETLRPGRGDAGDFGLSQREAQIAALIAKGLQNKEIAALLGTSPDTVRKQSIRIYEKTGASGRARLAALLGAPRMDSGMRSRLLAR